MTMTFIRMIVLLGLMHRYAAAAATEDVGDDGQCRPSYFFCGNDRSKCVQQIQLCDGVTDCSNGADEEQSFCFVDVDQKGSALKFIKKRNSTNQTCKQCELSEFPTQCYRCCSRGLYCSGGIGITKVLSQISGNLSKLILTDGSIPTVPAEVFVDFTSLTHISLRNNHIETVEPRAFQHLMNLDRLYLDHNNLQSLPLHLLDGLDKLYLADFSHNSLGIQHVDLNVFEDLPSLYYLDLTYNELSLKDQTFPKMLNLKLLYLSGNQIEAITEKLFKNLSALDDLQLEMNRIETVDRNAFKGLTQLTVLNLSFNKLHILHEDTFKKLTNLRTLSLDGNSFTSMAPNLFHPLAQVNFLSLKEIDIDNIETSMFDRMVNLNKTFFKRFHYCIFVPHSVSCEPRTDGVSSMEDLLAFPVLRWNVGLMVVLSCLGNAVVLCSRFAAHEEYKEWCIYIRNLAAADFLLGVYLFVIALRDHEYRGQYRRHANEWMSSDTCTVSGVLAMTSFQMSVLIVCFITIERYLSIAKPFNRGCRLKRPSAIVSMVILWTIGIAMAVLPLLFWRKHEFYGNNGMCFPLHIADPFVRGWEYTAFLFLVVDFVAVLLIGFVYTAMFINIRNTRNATPLVAQKDFAIRFFFIVFTDIICWTPMIVLKWIAIGNVPISADVYGWIVGFVVPINSAINPILYTFTTHKFKGMMHELIKSTPSIVLCRKTNPKELQVTRLFSSHGNGKNPECVDDCHISEGGRQQEASVMYTDRASRNSGVSVDTTVSIVSSLSDRKCSPTRYNLLNESKL